MRINADFTRRAAVTPDQHQWVASPQGGVERVMLDRVGAEKARATSLVRYARGSHFPPHEHPGGEEILVLSGTFSDESGDFPAGWYVRNPPGSAHRPASEPGATIFVKLWQMPPEDHRQVRVDTYDPAAWRREEEGREVCPLFESAAERVSLERLAAGQALPVEATRGAELLVLAGELVLEDDTLTEGSWLRLPPGDTPRLLAGAKGVTCYLKRDHLGEIRVPA
ncbi:anti-ECFsigma factor, ChrR [Halomonas shengliensis]|uniref:Anti-ECFsigma factor, ChrR n=1 Tax=Halomonas shengliensis TaxID=419597 RepID=A0A1H0HCX7_9GAMM|nr:cupin domain-containing protein [Halomonas shengliensis]SDO17066.1 anti-ECFsigma factor, ChrR [Halomonas shengliensis]